MGRPKKGTMSEFHIAIGEQIKTWRMEHEEWGPKTLLAELGNCKRFRSLRLPSRSVIARFLKEEGLITKPLTRRVTNEDVDKLPKVTRPHQRWQIDAKGNEQIQGVGTTCLINVKDVYTNLYTGSFPIYKPGKHDNPTGNDYRLALRLSFCEHGLPEQIQVDHAGVFFNNQHESPFPTMFHLWLIGLGIKLIFSRFRKPTDQGKVERQHRTMLSQVTSKTGFRDWNGLYERCEKRRQRMNWDIPCASLGEKAPMEVFPEQYHSQRIYRPETEGELFDMELVHKYLAQKSWTRKVSKRGTIKIAKKVYSISKNHVGQKVKINFESETKEFLFTDNNGLFLARHLARGLEQDRFMGNAPILLPENFQLQFPFDSQKELELRLYETHRTMSL